MVARPGTTRLASAALALSMLAGCGGAEGTKGDDSVASAAATDTATTTVSAPSSSAPSETTALTTSTTTTSATEEDIRDLRRAVGKVLKESPLTFATRSAELGKKAKKALRAIAEAAARHESPTLVVTTTAGYRDKNKAKKLSKQRADAIADELIANDLAEDRVEVKALGNGGDSDDSGTGVYAKITVAED